MSLDKMPICKNCLMPLTETEIKLKLFVNIYNFFSGHKTLTPICYTCYNKFAEGVGTGHYIGTEKVNEVFKR